MKLKKINRRNYDSFTWLCISKHQKALRVIKKYLKFPKDIIPFNSLSGRLNVHVNDENFTLDFPSREPVSSELPLIIKKSLSIQPQKILKSRDYFLVYNNQKEIEDIQIDQCDNRVQPYSLFHLKE